MGKGKPVTVVRVKATTLTLRLRPVKPKIRHEMKTDEAKGYTIPMTTKRDSSEIILIMEF